METTLAIVFIGLLVFLAHLFAGFFERTKIPDVLPLIGLGLVLGPVTETVTPEAFGKVGGIFTTVSLVIILFEGGIGMTLASLKESTWDGIKLSVVAYTFSIFIGTVVGVSAFGLPILEGMLLGAILAGTSAAVVMPLSEKLGLGERSMNVLKLEASFSDVFCIVTALAIIQAATAEVVHPGKLAGGVLSSFLVAAFLGGSAGIFWSGMLAHIRRMENSLFTTPAFVSIVYGLSEFMGYSGAIAALAFGITLGNIEFLPESLAQKLKLKRLRKTEEELYEEVVFILKTFFFVYMGVTMRFGASTILIGGLGLTTALFVSRIPAVRWTLSVEKYSRYEAIVAALMTPKGLAAAVLASLPLQAGLAGADIIQDVTYAVIIFSIVLTSALSFFAQKGMLDNSYGRAFGGFPAGESASESPDKDAS